MAAFKQARKIFGAVTGVALAANAAFMPFAAAAQDTHQPKQVELTQEEQVGQLDVADRAATAYARKNNGIGILIHVGADSFPNKHFANAEEFGQRLVDIFDQKFGVEARFFLRQNDARATGITYHIDTFIHGADNGTAVKLVGDAITAMPEVVEYLKIAKRDKVVQISQPAVLEPIN